MNQTTAISPSATVHASAVIGDGVVIGPGVVVEAGVSIGAGSRILVGTVLHTGSVIGQRCAVGPYAIVGGEPMDSAFRGEESSAVLEDGVSVREFASVHRATGEGAETRVGAGTLVMSYVHVSHNAAVGRGCVLTTCVQLGGHSEIGDHAVIGSSSVLHQFCRVGAYAMYGAASASNMDILPFSLARGNPARHYRLNSVGLKRHGIEGERYRAIERAVRLVRARDLAELETLAGDNEDARAILDFVRSSRRGVLRFVKAG